MYKVIKLRQEPEFIRIEHGSQVYYGGDQAWFEFTVGQQGGCGTVAAANLACCEVLDRPVYSKKEYVQLMNRMYTFVKPYKVPFVKKEAGLWRGFGWTFGVWPAGRLIRGFLRYGASEGVKLRPVLFRMRKGRKKDGGRDAALAFLRSGLSDNHPIAMLLNHRPALDRTPVVRPGGESWIQTTMGHHWVVITELEERDSRACLKVSTWGGYAYLDLDLCLEHAAWPEAMVYFEKV